MNAVLKRGRVVVDGCDVDDGFEVIDESPDLLELWRHNGSSSRPDLVAAGWQESFVSNIYSYGQTFEKSDPRLGGFVGFVEYRGYRLRFTERREKEVFALASRKLDWLLGYKADDLTAFGWVPDQGDAPPRPVLDKVLYNSTRSHREVIYAPLGRSFQVTRETADTLTLCEQHRDNECESLIQAGFRAELVHVQTEYDLAYNYEHYLEVPKLSGKLTGPFLRWVRHRGAPVRVIAEREGHVLAIAHSTLGDTFGFTKLTPGQSFRWIPIAEVEPVARDLL